MTTAHLFTRRKLIEALAGLGALGLAVDLQAQSDKIVRFILPNAAGSGVDVITRSVQAALGKTLGASVVIDNQPGAGGIVGLQALARSAPDGKTLSVVSNNVVIFPCVYKTLPFNMPGDFTPIAICGFTPVVLVVNPKVAATNAKEFAALLKSKPDELTYASGGNGTILHLGAAMYLSQIGATARHIPYKGVGPMLTGLIGGQVDFGVAALPSVQAHLKSGTLRAIGVASAQRLPSAPEIPTFVEQGTPGYIVDAWFAVIGPRGLAAGEAKRIHDAVHLAFQDPDVVEMMAKQGNIINVSSTEFAQQFFKTELVKYAALVKLAGVELQ